MQDMHVYLCTYYLCMYYLWTCMYYLCAYYLCTCTCMYYLCTYYLCTCTVHAQYIHLYMFIHVQPCMHAFGCISVL